ncbi:glycosyltransferase family 4 protein [Kineococcus rhizosphaerae]|uniref:glycosyltransferase family 4 protein n=1 Tax=Kineococcus rhizosphaerae TaxID=559628 RepID=UPI0011B1D1B1|nr:glycosyltransferase family 4 protein [Kineococcus rhizosphaerae]
MTRVTYVLDAPVWGGAEAVVAALVDELRESVRATVVAVRPVPQRLEAVFAGRCELVVVDPVAGKVDARAVLRLVAAVRNTRPDLVHVNLNSPTNNRYGLLAGLFSGAPSVATLHLPGALDSSVQRSVLALLYGAQDAVIAVSQEVRTLLIDTLRVDERRTRVVDNGVRRSRPAVPRSSVPSPRVIGTLGRLVPQKGIDVLLTAFRQLRAEGLDVRLRVGGTGPDEAALRAAAAGLPVDFDGDVGDVESWLDGLDVFCLASRSEGLPLALMEAMAAGLPCLATDVGQVRTALSDGVLLVPAQDPDGLAAALRAVCADAGLRHDLAGRGHELVTTRYSTESMARATAALYRAVILRPRRRLHRGRRRSRPNAPGSDG